MVTLDNGMTVDEARKAAKRRKTTPKPAEKPGPLIDGKFDPKDFRKPKPKVKPKPKAKVEEDTTTEEETVTMGCTVS